MRITPAEIVLYGPECPPQIARQVSDRVPHVHLVASTADIGSAAIHFMSHMLESVTLLDFSLVHVADTNSMLHANATKLDELVCSIREHFLNRAHPGRLGHVRNPNRSFFHYAPQHVCTVSFDLAAAAESVVRYISNVDEPPTFSRLTRLEVKTTDDSSGQWHNAHAIILVCLLTKHSSQRMSVHLDLSGLSDTLDRMLDLLLRRMRALAAQPMCLELTSTFKLSEDGLRRMRDICRLDTIEELTVITPAIESHERDTLETFIYLHNDLLLSVRLANGCSRISLRVRVSMHAVIRPLNCSHDLHGLYKISQCPSIPSLILRLETRLNGIEAQMKDLEGAGAVPPEMDVSRDDQTMP